MFIEITEAGRAYLSQPCPPVSYDVLITTPATDYHADRGVRAYIDGVRVPLAEARDLCSEWHVRLDCFSTSTSANGRRIHHRKVATI